ncbi:hypothetical protein A4X06_0g8134 [Tilletia controversa]|uniref:Uncharacterized protein n=1 Tax=Tilletia controversa TaxID=13291 RepID=A0A8X7MKT7_9BASI|nr:hypothetical protein A4X06_0g8134 [Tilletia controversa]
MAQADAINVDSMHLLLSTCRAAIKHTEAGPHAPPFPPELIDGLNSYVVKAPKASFKGLGTHSTPPSAAETANATRTDTHSNPSPPARGAPITTRTALPDSLQDWRVVGMGRGSARAAATAEGLKDFRLFARYDSNHPTLNLDPSVQRDLANSTLDTALAPPGARISVVDKVSSGLALTPTGGCTVEELEPHFARIAAALGATRVERNENWHRWVLRDIPTFIDNKLVDENDLRAEIIARLRIVDPDRPHSLVGNVRRLCAQGAAQNLKTTCVTFSTSVGTSLRAGRHFDLFGRRAWLEVYRPLKALECCELCLSFSHRTNKCTALQPRCAHCSAWGHSIDAHTCTHCKDEARSCLPRCPHCRGPHKAGFEQCPGRAKFDKKARAFVHPKGDTLNAILKAGDQARRKTLLSDKQAGPEDAAAAATST